MRIVLSPPGVLAFRFLGGSLAGFVLSLSYRPGLDALPLSVFAGLLVTLFGLGDFRRRMGETVLNPLATLRSREFWIGVALNIALALVLNRMTEHGVNVPLWALGMTLLNLAQDGRVTDEPNPYTRPWGRRR